MEHTPGPWKTTQTSSHVFIDNENQGGVICKMPHEGSSLQWACGPASLENSANARLIAAAPDMFEAGRELARLAIQSNRYSEDMDFRDAIDNWFHIEKSIKGGS